MEVGLRNKPIIGAIIQARMGSSRMPGKVLLPLPINGNTPILGHIVNSLQLIKKIDRICIATSLDVKNDPIRRYAEQENLYSLSGSEDDVLGRFCSIAKDLKLDIIIRFTADDPLLSIFHIDQMLELFLSNKVDYLCTKGLPLGMNIEIISAQALLSQCNNDLQPCDREHVTAFIKRSGLYKVKEVTVSTSPIVQKMRCTIDYPSDYSMMNILYSFNDFKSKDNITLLENIQVKYPWIFDINRSNIQNIVE